MKRFIISAIVDERNLFDLMKHLEDIRAGGIMARPHIVDDEPTHEKKVFNRGGRAAWNGAKAKATEAILAALAKDGEFTLLDLKQKFGLSGANNATYALQRDGVIKRIAKGKYAKGKNFEKGIA